MPVQYTGFIPTVVKNRTISLQTLYRLISTNLLKNSGAFPYNLTRLLLD